MTVSINTYEYPVSTPVTATYNLTEDGELENIIRPAIITRKQGRNINFTFIFRRYWFWLSDGNYLCFS